MITENQIDSLGWFVQKGSRVQGPRKAGEIQRYLLLGRIRGSDRVSRDGKLWEPVTQVPELIPEEMLALDKDSWSECLDSLNSGSLFESEKPQIQESPLTKSDLHNALAQQERRRRDNQREDRKRKRLFYIHVLIMISVVIFIAGVFIRIL